MPASSGTAAGAELVWIRLSPIRDDAPSLDVEVDKSGVFRISTVLGGPYVLVVNRGDEVRHIQVVAFEQGLTIPKPFVVRLAEKRPDVIHVR